MKTFKRHEPFRYTFSKPIDALFEITKIDDRTVSTSTGEAQIMDLSPQGLKLNSTLEIPETEHKSIQLTISFKLNDKKLKVNGMIVWIKSKGTSFDYGINLENNETLEKEIIKQLKVYSRKKHQLEH